MKKLLGFLLTYILCSLSLAEARALRAMPIDEMTAKSDLVVLAVPYRTTLTKDTYPGHTPEQSKIYDAYNTDFEIQQVVKNDGIAKQNITVLHFLYTRDPKRMIGVVNGSLFVKFLGEGAPKSQEPLIMNPRLGGQNTVWLAFLTRRPDGRYEPVGGQLDSSTSFRVLKCEYFSLSDAPAAAGDPAPNSPDASPPGGASTRGGQRRRGGVQVPLGAESEK